MSKLIYFLFIKLYPFAVSVAAPFNPKAKAWLHGRQNVFDQLEAALKRQDKVIWLHCSSLGEFEQGRPVIEKLKAGIGEQYKILLTFFSPSGYEVTKNYKGADFIFYLPMDSKQNANRFFTIVKPQLIIFVKYEFWFHYLDEARQRNIPLLLISGIFRKDQPFFKWYGDVHRQMLKAFTHFFVQNQASAKLLQKLGYTNNVTVSGDTRFDRVIKIAESFTEVPFIESFCGNYPVVVAGSTWTEDDKELDHFANTNLNVRFIIAPHNVGPDRIEECLRLYKNAIRYSQLTNISPAAETNTVIIDNIGMLSRLYKYATVCYVGGAFGADGVHNVLEPAVYGKPVVFGPSYEKYFEAEELIDAGAAFSIDNALELEAEFTRLLGQSEEYTLAATRAKEYVYQKAGSTGQIVTYIYEKRLLTN